LKQTSWINKFSSLGGRGAASNPHVQAKMSMTQSQLRANEAELIKNVCGGQREAFYELLRPYERMIYATAISVVRNPADSEEVAQEAVLKAFSRLSTFRAESRFSTWLMQG
jgi:RNA polymerase sigma-70 factor, ECF subfamily